MKMPPAYLFKNGWTKYILRKAMQDYLPKEVLWRKKKMGFPFAYATYFKAQQNKFEPYLNTLKASPLNVRHGLDYTRLLQQDPAQLWRMLSVAIWMTP
jgi:asparagine synthase (glutamine-hydrolysing)